MPAVRSSSPSMTQATALVSLRQACHAWQAVNAPYEVARARTLLGLACRELGDDDSASWELTTARDAFRRLGAAPDAARLTALIDAGSARRHRRPHRPRTASAAAGRRR